MQTHKYIRQIDLKTRNNTVNKEKYYVTIKVQLIKKA